MNISILCEGQKLIRQWIWSWSYKSINICIRKKYMAKIANGYSCQYWKRNNNNNEKRINTEEHWETSRSKKVIFILFSQQGASLFAIISKKDVTFGPPIDAKLLNNDPSLTSKLCAWSDIRYFIERQISLVRNKTNL